MPEYGFEKLPNTRDLGGIVGDGGRRIRPGRLIRSGRLGVGSVADIRRIGELASIVIDFRSENERAETPDPDIPGVEYRHIPIIESLAAGVSRDRKSDEEVFLMLVHDPEGTFAYSCNCYRGFVSSETARKGYRAFIDLLLEGRERAILWHCTAGKDRAGFAAAIVLALLGVSMDRIFEDYLLQRFHKSDVAHNI